MSQEKFLKNPLTGQVMRSNPSLEKRTDLMPCDQPWADEPVKDTTPPESKKDLLTEKEGAMAVFEWVNREVANVTIADLRAFAEEKELDIPGRLNKLELVTAINTALAAKE